MKETRVVVVDTHLYLKGYVTFFSAAIADKLYYTILTAETNLNCFGHI